MALIRNSQNLDDACSSLMVPHGFFKMIFCDTGFWCIYTMNKKAYNTSITVKGQDMQEEQQLLQAFSSGDYSAIETLVLRYEDSLFGLCLKLTMNRPDAEDLYQQMWLKAMQRPQSCTRSFKNWMYTICVNSYKDSVRRKKTAQRIISSGEEAEYALAVAADDETAENAAINNLTNKWLVTKVAQLQDIHRITVILHYFQGLDYKECAKVLGLPIGTVKSRLNAAKKTLRMQMEEEHIV